MNSFQHTLGARTVILGGPLVDDIHESSLVGGLSTQSIQHGTSCRIELHPRSILLQRILKQNLTAAVVRSLKRGERASVSIVLEHLKLPIQRKVVKEPVAGCREYQRDPGTPTASVEEGPCEVLGGVLVNSPHQSMTVCSWIPQITIDW